MGIQINGNTNNINAGIGSLSIEDLNELDIVGVATASNFKTGSSNLHSTGLTVGNNFLHSTGINVGTGATIHVPATNVLAFGTNSNERLRIASDGKILMGVAANNGPAAPLHIYGGSDTTPILAFTRSSTHDDWQGAGIGLDDEGGSYKGALTFYTHGSSGTKNDSVIERLRIDSNGRLSFAGDTDTYIWHPSANQLAITRGGASFPIVRIGTGGNGGTIGIGTDSNLVTSGEIISVRGYSSFKSVNNLYAALYTHNEQQGSGICAHILFNVGGANRGGFGYDTDNSTLIMGNHNDISFRTGVTNLNGTERMLIKNTGGIGIATDKIPRNYFLHIAAPSQDYTNTSTQLTDGGGIMFQHTDTLASTGRTYPGIFWSGNTSALGRARAGIIGVTASNNDATHIAFLTRVAANGTSFYPSDERMRITSTGQLLLGETSAFDSNVAIQFRKDNAGNQSRFIFRNRGNNGSSRVRLILSTLNRAANADKFSGMEMYQSGGLTIFNGESDNAHSGINLFSGNWASLRLRNGNVSGNDVAHIAGYWGTSNGLMIEQGGPQSGTFKAIRFETSHYGGERGYIGVTLGGTSYNSSSDYRMKQDVVDLTGAIDRVKSFKPRRFKWKEDPTYTVDGFLAHEASTVVPESVDGEKDAVDENGDPKYQVMDNSKLVPVLTAALKEAIAKIETLETKVAALEGS